MQLVRLTKISTLLSCIALTTPVHADAVNLAVGLNGVALEYYLSLSPKLNARFVLSDMPLDIEEDDDDATVNIKYDRTNIGMLFDFRPLSGSFHLTTGIYVGDHNIGIKAAVNENQQFDVGDESYYGRNLGINSKISFAKAAPYFGIGWGNSTTSKGFTANFDIGVLYVGKASIDINATGEASLDNSTWLDVSGYADFQKELETERRNLEDDAKDLQLLPIIQLGLGYKF